MSPQLFTENVFRVVIEMSFDVYLPEREIAISAIPSTSLCCRVIHHEIGELNRLSHPYVEDRLVGSRWEKHGRNSPRLVFDSENGTLLSLVSHDALRDEGCRYRHENTLR